MRRVVVLILIFLVCPDAAPAGGRDAWQGILQGVLGEIDRQQQIDADRQRRRTSAEINACFDGHEAACHRALQSPWLVPEGRRDIHRQLQAIAEHRAAEARAYDTFVADWTRCRDEADIAACETALAYPSLSDNDRQRLMHWQQAARERAVADAQREAERQAAATLQTSVPVLIPKFTSTIETASITPAASTTPNIRPELIFLLTVTSFAAVISWRRRSDLVNAPPAPSATTAEPLHSPFVHGPPAADLFHIPMTGHFPTDVRRVLAGPMMR